MTRTVGRAKARAYSLSEEYERAMLALVITNPGAWANIGKHLDRDKLTQEPCKVLLALATAAAGEAGWPGGANMLYAWAAMAEVDGTYTRWALNEATAAFEAGYSVVESQDPIQLTRTLTAAVRKTLYNDAAKKLLDAWASGRDLTHEKAVEALMVAQAMGTVAASPKGASTREARKRALREAMSFRAMPTGFAELDAGMGGGLTIGNVGGILGGPGDGKSTAMAHTSAYLTGIQKLFVGYASAELKVYQVSAKYEAALFGIPIRLIRENPDITDSYYEEHGDNLGPFSIRHFDMGPGAKPTIADVDRWIDEEEQLAGRKMDALCIDYGDRFVPSKPKHRGSTYSMGEIVCDEEAELADRRKIPIWTGSATVRAKKSLLWGGGDGADSQHKERRFDAFYSVNALGSPQGRTMTLHLFKNREGDSSLVIGPKPVGFAYGRLYETALLDRVDPEYAGLFGVDDQAERLRERGLQP